MQLVRSAGGPVVRHITLVHLVLPATFQIRLVLTAAISTVQFETPLQTAQPLAKRPKMITHNIKRNNFGNDVCGSLQYTGYAPDAVAQHLREGARHNDLSSSNSSSIFGIQICSTHRVQRIYCPHELSNEVPGAGFRRG